MDYKKIFQDWITQPYFDEKTKQELLAIQNQESEIKERFYKILEFGTGGLRGLIGAGTNRMNVYTVRMATQGLANYIKKFGKEGIDKGVAIAYDSRHMSAEFAREAALVLNGNGIKAYVFDSLRATPELSFAVRTLGCIAGIVVTASHNPPEYNGYKVYWEDGAQVTSPKDIDIIKEVNLVTSLEEVMYMDYEEARDKGLYQVIEKELDDTYIATLKTFVMNQEVINKEADSLKIIYTPLHGTGNRPVRRVLEEIGFKQVFVVPEQEQPDPNFSTVGYPNPEDIKAFELALKLAKEKDGDLLLATDPDADRIGVLVKHKDTYIPLTGNMTGVLLADYIIEQKLQNGTFPANGALIKTIVTTNMVDAITRYYGIGLIEVLTGFKFIAEKIKEFETTGQYEYLFGFEESYGYLIGTHARDKDAIVTAMVLCEVAAYYKSQGLTLWEVMMKLYQKYGFYREGLESITLKGIEGMEQMKHILDTLRKAPPTILGKYSVLKLRDYQGKTETDLLSGQVGTIDLPTSNVLYFELSEDAWFCVRPSGTEPKIKIYFGVKGHSIEDSEESLKVLTKNVMKIIQEIIEL